MADRLQALEELLTRRIGLDTTSVGSQLIARAVKQRMRDLKLDDLIAYERLAQQSDTELQELIEEVIVAESWFFRDERPFDWLREYVRSRWVNEPARPLLRILSLACASGEEPYSIAMMLGELGLKAERYRIDAVDISARRLANAQRGIFSQNAFRGPVARHQSRYFRQCAEGYEIEAKLRGAVQFIQGNILDPVLLQESSVYDVLFCRNVLIYLIPEARAGLLATIDRILAPDGILLIGHADRLDSANAQTAFTPVGNPGCFAFRRLTSGELAYSKAMPSLQMPEPISSLLAPTATTVIEPTNWLELAAGVVGPVSPETTNTSIPGAAESPLLLDQAADLANKGQFSEAIALCERYLRQKGLTAPAYYLMGMICQASGDLGRAEDCFQKTVYLDPRHAEALLALALLAERRGEMLAAAGFRRRAARATAGSSKRVN